MGVLNHSRSRSRTMTDNVIRLDSLRLSPQKGQEPSGFGVELYSSPTRVLDFPDEEGQFYPEEIPYEMTEAEEEKAPPLDITPIFCKSRSIHRDPSRKRKYFHVNVLPTLEEASSGSWGEGEEENNSFSNSWSSLESADVAVLLTNGDQFQKLDTRQKCDRKQKIVKPRSYVDRIKDMEDKALNLAETGNEEEAIILFRKIVHRNASEIDRVKDQMAQVEGKHVKAVDSIHSRLREDWSTISLSTGFVRMCLANLYEREGNYKKAFASCRDALDTYHRHAQFVDADVDGISSAELAQEAEKVLEQMKRAQASFDERKERHKQIIALRNRMNATGDLSLICRVEEMTIRAKDREIEMLGEEHPQVADTYLLLSELAQENCEQEKALRYAMEALRINKLSLGDPHPQTGRNLLQIARLHDVHHNDDAALDFYNRSLAVFRPLTNSKDVIGSILNNAAIIHIRQRHLDAAIDKLKEALASYEESGKPGRLSEDPVDTSSSCELVQVWRNLGECYHLRQEYKEASSSLVNALGLQRDIRRVYDSLNQRQLGQVANDKPLPCFATDSGIAETLRRLGKAYRADGKATESIAVLREAILIHRKGVSRASLTANNAKGAAILSERQDELANSLYCLAEVCLDTNDLKSATKFFGDSFQLRLSSDANTTGNRTNMVHCAMCLTGMGNVHLQRHEYQEAHKVFSHAITYCDAHGMPSALFVCRSFLLSFYLIYFFVCILNQGYKEIILFTR